MIQVRPGIFETNSSSVHAIAYCTKQEFMDFMDEKLMFDVYDEKLVPYTRAYDPNLFSYRELERIENDWSFSGTASAELVTLSDGTQFGVVKYDKN